MLDGDLNIFTFHPSSWFTNLKTNGDDDDDDDDEEEHLAEPLSTAANVSPACFPLLRV